MLKRFTPPSWLFRTEIKKKYKENFLIQTKKFIYILGFKIKSKRLKAPTAFGENNHIFLNGREVQNIKGFEIYIEGDNNKIEISLSEKSEIFSSKIYISGSKNLIQILAPKLLDHLNIFVGQ